MVLQEQEKRRPKAALGETPCAAMTVHAAVGKQPLRRFARIDVLGLCRAAAAQIKACEDEEAAGECRLAQKLR